MTDTALGSETGGSVRQPASFCGVVGIKPSYGRVSRFGLVAFGSSLDCISTFGRDTRDAARLLCAISGHDELDATTRELPPLEMPVPRGDLRGLVVGLPREYFPADLHAGVRAACDRAIAAACAISVPRCATVSLPHTRFAVPTYYIVNPAEAAANLARFEVCDTVRGTSARRATCARSIAPPAVAGSAPRCAAESSSAHSC